MASFVKYCTALQNSSRLLLFKAQKYSPVAHSKLFSVITSNQQAKMPQIADVANGNNSQVFTKSADLLAKIDFQTVTSQIGHGLSYLKQLTKDWDPFIKLSFLAILHDKNALQSLVQLSYLTETLDSYLKDCSKEEMKFTYKELKIIVRSIGKKIINKLEIDECPNQQSIFITKTLPYLLAVFDQKDLALKICSHMSYAKEQTHDMTLLLAEISQSNLIYRCTPELILLLKKMMNHENNFLLVFRYLCILKKLDVNSVDTQVKALIKNIEYTHALSQETFQALTEYVSLKNCTRNPSSLMDNRIALMNGTCSACGKPLGLCIKPSDEMLERLSVHMVKKIKADFRNDNNILDKFNAIINENFGKYTGVIDMANLYYSSLKNVKKISILIRKFRATLSEPKNILFINKSSLKQSNFENGVLRKADIMFRPEILSLDDDLAILAALRAGYNCKILSNDMFNNNINNEQLDNELKHGLAVFLNGNRVGYDRSCIIPRKGSYRTLDISDDGCSMHSLSKHSAASNINSDEWICMNVS